MEDPAELNGTDLAVIDGKIGVAENGAAELSFAGFFSGIFDETTMKSAILIWRTITYYGTIFISAPFSGMGKKKATELVTEMQEEIEEVEEELEIGEKSGE